MSTTTPETIRLVHGTWDELRALTRPLRIDVFVHEQQVPLELEIDELDPESVHLAALDTAGRCVATGRLTPDGHIGRLAVAAAHRGRGLGGRVLEALVQSAIHGGWREVVLHAQVHAIPFYEAHGFIAHGGVFDDAGIPHKQMTRVLPTTEDA